MGILFGPCRSVECVEVIAKQENYDMQRMTVSNIRHFMSAAVAIFTISLQADTLQLLLPKPVKGERLSGSVTAEA